MKSRAHIKGHPMHPILVSFPIAFFTGSLLFDLASLFTGKMELWQTGYWLQITGVGFALLAAVPGAIVIILELTGIVSLSIAGWMGGTLVYRNQIGVDPRYAWAGKWKEKFFKESKGPVEVAARDELKTNQMQLLHINGKRIVLAKTENNYVAFDDHCTHRGGSLAGGSMICNTVQCPWHGSQFDVTSGNVKAGPAKEKINTYAITETEGKVFLNL